MLSSRVSTFIFVLPIFLVSLTIHEYAHAWMAYRYGDDTAKRMGRLTLNPFAHISLFGTIILPLLVHFGWAKPIPVNFTILTKRQIFAVAAAGPLSNILLALILAVLFRMLSLEAATLFGKFVLLAILFNIILAVFNLIPIPPLDGSHLLAAFLPQPLARYYSYLEPVGFVLIIILLFTGILGMLIIPLYRLIAAFLHVPMVF